MVIAPCSAGGICSGISRFCEGTGLGSRGRGPETGPPGLRGPAARGGGPGGTGDPSATSHSPGCLHHPAPAALGTQVAQGWHRAGTEVAQGWHRGGTGVAKWQPCPAVPWSRHWWHRGLCSPRSGSDPRVTPALRVSVSPLWRGRCPVLCVGRGDGCSATRGPVCQTSPARSDRHWGRSGGGMRDRESTALPRPPLPPCS